MTDNTLIFGLAAGYHYGDVRPFLLSLDRVGYAGKTILFVSKTTRGVDMMRKHGATIIPLEHPNRLTDVPYNGLRYFLYQDYLRSSDRTFDRILLTDVRDVFFQQNPFSHPWADGLNCTLEDLRVTLATCPFNAHWIREHLGRDTLDAIGHHPISCSGTTVGDHQAMTDYLEHMTSLLHPPTTGECMAGYDQGIHNMLIRTGRLENITLHDNTGPILTLAQCPGEPEIDAQARVLNDAGAPAHIIHQYDRKPQLFKKIRSLCD